MELIDKQAAVDAINEIIRMEHSLRPKVYVAKDAIKKLPSAQPTFDARDTQYNLPIGTDLISRQAAIDALKTDMASLDHIIKGMSANDVRLDAYVSQRNQVNYDICTINSLPTAQPEIIRCKDCKYWKRSSCCEGYCGEIDMEGFDEDHYCGFAERRGATE
jgi:hypothetical protein